MSVLAAPGCVTRNVPIPPAAIGAPVRRGMNSARADISVSVRMFLFYLFCHAALTAYRATLIT